MKNIFLVILITGLVFSCKQPTEKPEETVHLTDAQKIANAHGIAQWDKISQLEFRFKVDRENNSGSGRMWIWKPKSDDVTLITETDTISYNRKDMDSISLRTDRAFINDKFWLLIPYQLVWDEGTTISDPEIAESPINKQQLNKITLTYSDKGGYTPGDAYDLFYDDNYILKEWIYRAGNSPDPSLTNTFENIQDFNGLKLALEHKKSAEGWNLNFTDVKVILD